MGEIGAPIDDIVVESPTPDVVMTVVTIPILVGVDASTAQDTALVLASPRRPTSPSAKLATSSQHLDDDVVQQFDATHCLSELTAAWGILAAGMTSFEEKLQVSSL